jgi:hypothetical protein
VIHALQRAKDVSVHAGPPVPGGRAADDQGNGVGNQFSYRYQSETTVKDKSLHLASRNPKPRQSRLRQAVRPLDLAS